MAIDLRITTSTSRTAARRITIRSREQTAAFSTKAELDMNGANNENYGIRVFYDRVFGTFAFKKVGLGSERASGLALGRGGRPLVNGLVQLMVGGQSFTTRTDATGRGDSGRARRERFRTPPETRS